MSIISAFGFTALGMALAHLYNWLAWRKYYEGKRERDRDRRSGGEGRSLAGRHYWELERRRTRSRRGRHAIGRFDR